jgi:poly-gamma-glutamate synthesis protein (capsule biosynthesis protein)
MGGCNAWPLNQWVLKHSDPAYPWRNTLSILQNVDLRICNLECVLSDIGNPWSTTPNLIFSLKWSRIGR